MIADLRQDRLSEVIMIHKGPSLGPGPEMIIKHSLETSSLLFHPPCTWMFLINTHTWTLGYYGNTTENKYFSFGKLILPQLAH